MGQCQSTPVIEDSFEEKEMSYLKMIFKQFAKRYENQTQLSITLDSFGKIINLPGALGERSFQYFDTNHDSYLTFNELAEGIKKICGPDKTERQRFIFFLYDTSCTNTITRAEFRFLSCHFPPSVLKALVAQCAKLKVSGADEWLKRNITIRIKPNEFNEAVNFLEEVAFKGRPANYELSFEDFVQFLDTIQEIYEFFESVLPYDYPKDSNMMDYGKTTPRGDVTRVPLPFHQSFSKLSDLNLEAEQETNKEIRKNYDTWNRYTKAYWCIECRNCKKQVRFCTNCRGSLYPVEYTPTEVSDADNQTLECSDCHRIINLHYCSACGTRYARDRVDIRMDNPQDNAIIPCKGGELYTLSRLHKLNKRYVYIRSSFMYYYESESSSGPDNIYFLGNCEVEQVTNSYMENKGYYGFSLKFPEHETAEEFYTRNKQDLDTWIYLIKQVTTVRQLTDTYEVLGKIGEGKFAIVYKCRHKETNELYAVKEIKKNRFKSEKEYHLIQTEIGILGMVNHPNIVKFYDNFENDDAIYIVMELITGGELFDRIAGRHVLTELEAYRVLYPIIDCLAYLHRMCIVHRDLKPENIFCGKELWDIKIGDFGLSQIVSPTEKIHVPCGTMNYMSPELISNQGYTTKTDMWSIGVILYLILRGQLPIKGKNKDEVITNTIKHEIDFECNAIRSKSKEV